jgi:hypothetical protein
MAPPVGAGWSLAPAWAGVRDPNTPRWSSARRTKNRITVVMMEAMTEAKMDGRRRTWDG